LENKVLDIVDARCNRVITGSLFQRAHKSW